MLETDLENILSKDAAKIYFVGIGGIAMSAAANIAASFGYEIQGSDSKEIYSPAKDVLDDSKISYFKSYSEENVKNSNADLFVLSAGEDLNNPEVKYIEKNKLPHLGFPELIYFLTRDKLRVVATGTHGKSTTTGLLGHIFKNLDDSSFMAGAVLQNYSSNFHLGVGNYFVIEGDEYKSEYDDPTPKFHYYKADILVLTNLEYDHPDLFPNFKALEDEFRHLIANMPQDGLIVYNADDVNLSRLVHESNVSSASYGIDNEADFRAEQIQYGEEFTTIEVINKFSKNISSKLLGQTEQYKIQLPGKINVYNALAAIATLRSLGFAQDQIALDLLIYKGVKRRFEIVAVKKGITIVDDYAHHPTAVRETLNAARLKFPKSKIWAIFEPHTFSRTEATLEDLTKSFEGADEVLISDIYPAREKKTKSSVTSEQVVEAVKQNAKNARLIHNKKEALEILKNEVKPGEAVIIMAVGDFNRLAYDLKDIL